MYRIGDKVILWWQGKEISGTVIEIPHAHCYRVRIWTGEIVYRLESDLEKEDNR